MAKAKSNYKPRHHMPFWMRMLNPRQVPRSIKDFYGYLCAFGPDTCWQWNCRLSKKFGVSKRTIQRWLRWLKDRDLIWIEEPFGNRRKIHARYFKNALDWFSFMTGQKLRKHSRRARPGRQDLERSRQRNLGALQATQGMTKMSPKNYRSNKITPQGKGTSRPG